MKFVLQRGGLHLQNRPEGCRLQCSSTQRTAAISTVSFGRELVRVPVCMLWLGFSSPPRIFTNLLKVPNSVLRCLTIRAISYLEDLLILGNSMNEIFMARNSVIFQLQHLGFVINLKKCVFRSYKHKKESSWVDLVITSGKDREDKGS